MEVPGITRFKIGFEKIVEKIRGDAKGGISKDEVEKRRDWYGTNARKKQKLRTICEILCTVLEDTMLRILLVASIATIIINEIVEEHERATGTI
jgi:magnesium-transporting ATPase (P-type)